MSLSAQSLLLNQILFSLEAGQSLEKSLTLLKNQKLSKNLKIFLEDFHFYLKRGYGRENFLFQKYFHKSLVPYLHLGMQRQQFILFLKAAVKLSAQMLEFRARLLQLCLYPAILMTMMFIFLGTALLYLIPQMKTLFNDMNMPVPSLVVFLEKLPIIFLSTSLILMTVYFLFKDRLNLFFQNKAVKVSFVYILFFLPFLSSWVSFLKAGLNEEEALSCALPLLPQILRLNFYELSLGLKAGYSLEGLIQTLTDVPQIIKNHIQTSVQDENLIHGLEFLKTYLEDAQNKTVQLFFVWMEPVLMIFMGGVVAAFLMIIFMPFLNLSQNYGVTL